MARARIPELDREVAVKVPTDRLAQDPEALDRFEREARRWRRLAATNILAHLRRGPGGRRPMSVTELLRGADATGASRPAR